MTKYRNLQIEELKALEPDFVNFLATQGVAAEDWKKWQEENHAKRDAYIALFSDFVFETLIGKTNFLFLNEINCCRYVKVNTDKFQMIILSNKGSVGIADVNNLDLSSQDIEIQKGEKVVGSDKKSEVFKLFEQGFLPVKKVNETSVEQLFYQIFNANH
jgi:hypothetical protein